MSAQATVPVTFTPAQSSAKTQPLAQEGSAGPSRYHNIQERRVSYGAVTEESGSLDRLLGAKGKDPELSYQDGEEEEYVEGYEDDLDPVIDGTSSIDEHDVRIDDCTLVTWKYMSRLYLLVPLITVIFLILLILLVTFAW